MASRSVPANLPTLQVRLVCEGIPVHRFEGFDGKRSVRVELQTKTGHQPGRKVGSNAVAWEILVAEKRSPDGAPDFSGPAVHGKRGERFFYLSWSGEVAGTRVMFRRIKIHLRDLTMTQLVQARKPANLLEARVHAVAKDDGPACASVPLLGAGWTVRPVEE